MGRGGAVSSDREGLPQRLVPIDGCYRRRVLIKLAVVKAASGGVKSVAACRA